jgi:hypothetical protein
VVFESTAEAAPGDPKALVFGSALNLFHPDSERLAQFVSSFPAGADRNFFPLAVKRSSRPLHYCDEWETIARFDDERPSRNQPETRLDPMACRNRRGSGSGTLFPIFSGEVSS